MSNEVAGSLPLTLELQPRSSGAVPDQSYLEAQEQKPELSVRIESRKT